MATAAGSVVIFNTTRVQITLSLNNTPLYNISPISSTNNFAPVAGAAVSRDDAASGTDPVFYTNSVLTATYGGVSYTYKINIDPGLIDTDTWLQLFVYYNSMVVLSNHGFARMIAPATSAFA